MFVGDERVSEDVIDGYVEGIADLRVEQGEDLAIHDFAEDREQAVIYVLYAELGRAADLGPVDTAGAADEFEELYLEAAGYYEAIMTASEPRELTQAEMEALVAAAAEDPGLAGATVADLQMLAGFTDDLAAYVDEYGIAVNPRYGDFDLSPLPSIFPVEVPQR